MTTPTASARAPNPVLVWVKGGHAEIVSIDDDAIVVRSTIPSPPGSRLRATFTDAPSTAPRDVCVKVFGSKREPEGSFIIKGRLIDANRELRACLLMATSSATRGPLAQE